MATVESKKVYPYDGRVAAIHILRVNVKSLAAEAGIIRKEARRCGIQYEMQLTLHRRTYLRRAARVAQLSLAFVRGRPYRTVEKFGPPPLDLVNFIFSKLAKVRLPGSGVPRLEKQITEWLTAS